MATTDWDGKNTAAEPGTRYDRGYDVRTTVGQTTQSGVNAYLMDEADHTHVLLTLVAIETSLSLAGSRGQGPLQVDFYPRNFQQPSFTLVIQARSQEEIGRVAEFVHKAQRNAVSQGSLMRVIIPGGGLKGTAASSVNDEDGMRGTRRGISMSGYVADMPRSHKRHDPAPQYPIEFVVAKMHVGIFEDQPYKVYKLAKWSEIVESQLEGNFIKPPMTIEQENQAEAVHEAEDTVKSLPFFGDAFGNPFDNPLGALTPGAG
jgi:hypothetical protein